jgi:hypothetical protein
MSLLNVFVGPGRIDITADTDCVAPDGTHTAGTKLVHIPHLNAVVAGRGNMSITNWFALVALETLGRDFDAVADAMPTDLGDVRRHLIAIKKLTVDGSAQDVFLAGWSPRRGRLQALHYVLRDDAFVLNEDIISMSLNPRGCFADPPRSNPRPDVFAIARQQVEWLRANWPGVGAGGRLIVAQLMRDRVSISTGVSLEARSDTAAPVV